MVEERRARTSQASMQIVQVKRVYGHDKSTSITFRQVVFVNKDPTKDC